MDRHTQIGAAAAEILRRLELTPAEVADRVARARDAAHWRALAPELAVGDDRAVSPLPVADDAMRETASQLRHDRYFRTPILIAPGVLAAMNRALDRVTAAGWPPVFVMVYDAFWRACRVPALARLLEAHFESDFVQIPHLWIHIVPAVGGAIGWMPHFDGLRQARVSVWLALTDATVDNGCIHIVPPEVLPEVFRTTNLDTTVVMSDVLRAMHGTRAMPVRAGAALGWEFDVFHWGGRAVNPLSERRAISMEFLSAAHAPEADEVPVIANRGALPSFEERLQVIALALQTYANREPLMRRFRPIADQLAR